MRFGLFDHVDRNDQPLARQYDERLEFVAAAEEAGFFEYHCAEHHATPLSAIPSPSVYLAAVARATRRMRLGPLCYLLPLYRPLRLIEEICMLDHLSHGRLDVGVGRGVSPFELRHQTLDPDLAREIFAEALDVIRNGLTHDRLTHEGKHFTYRNVPMEMRPLQTPHPPIWYPSSNADGARFAARNGFHYCALGGISHAAGLIAAFREAFAARGSALTPFPDFPGGGTAGVSRQLVIGDSDDDARRIALPAYDRWYSALTKLERDNVGGPRVSGAHYASLDEAAAQGSAIVGSPETVHAEIARQLRETGANYMIFSCFFGIMPPAHALRTIRQFGAEIMPKFAPGGAA